MKYPGTESKVIHMVLLNALVHAVFDTTNSYLICFLHVLNYTSGLNIEENFGHSLVGLTYFKKDLSVSQYPKHCGFTSNYKLQFLLSGGFRFSWPGET